MSAKKSNRNPSFSDFNKTLDDFYSDEDSGIPLTNL
jgi:hypothetical protein